MSYKIIEILGGSFNLNFVLEDTVTKKQWIGKISKRLTSFNLDFIDLDERALVAQKLASLLEVNVPKSLYISEKEIMPSENKKFILTAVREHNYLFNDQEIFLTEKKGKSLPNYLEKKRIDQITNLDHLIKSLVFNLWIGNYDKKDEDYVVVNSGEAFSIDYSLCGPGFRNDDRNSIGYFACKFSIENVNDTGYVIGEILRRIIINNNYGLNFFEEEILRIEGLTLEEITRQFDNLEIQREVTHENINQIFIDFLMARKLLIRGAISAWIDAGYIKPHKDTNYCR